MALLKILLGYGRKWNFFLGDLLGEEHRIVGWISRIGYAYNLIREMGLPTISATYTLVPHRLAKIPFPELTDLLLNCTYLEIVCDGEKLFHDLYTISPKVDSYLVKLITAINITYDKYGMASIKIIVKWRNSYHVYREVSKVHCGVELQGR